MTTAIQIREPADLLPFLEKRIDPERQLWLLAMEVKHAVVRGQASSLRQANAANCEILMPAMIARSICMLVKWAVERPHLSNKPGYFPVQRTLSGPTVSWFMDHRTELLDQEFPDAALFKKLLEKMRREGVRFTVETMSKGYLQ